MYILGVTGSFGSGKTTVAKLLRDKGAKVLDADKIAHAFLAPRTPTFKRIIKRFGSQVLTQGRLDRQKIAEIVFNDRASLKKLCAILHPAVAKEIKAKIKRYRAQEASALIVVDAPLLFEAGLDALCDGVAVVWTTKKNQICRLQRRSGLTKKEILKRMAAQMPMAQKRARAHFVIDNQGLINQTKQQVEALWHGLKTPTR